MILIRKPSRQSNGMYKGMEAWTRERMFQGLQHGWDQGSCDRDRR